jgi:hypothetical protein
MIMLYDHFAPALATRIHQSKLIDATHQCFS